MNINGLFHFLVSSITFGFYGPHSHIGHAGHIFAHSTTILIGRPVNFTCSIENPAHNSGEFYMYLCKDDVGIRMNRAKVVNNFSVKTSSSDASGYYSCFYSTAKMASPHCPINGEDSVYISVYGKTMLIITISFTYHLKNKKHISQIFLLFTDFL